MCETKTAIAAHTHTHTNFCDYLEKITLLCMAGVTSIQENIIEKHYTEEEGIYVENNAELSLKVQSDQKCRSKPTASLQLEKVIEVLLEIPLRQYAATATPPGLHLPLETITEDLRNFGLLQISSNLNEVEKEVKHYSKVQEEIQEIQEGERCHTSYISFRSGVSTTVMHSAMQSWYCFDWSLSRCKHDTWRHCGRLCGYFLCFGCNQQETAD